MTDIYIVIQHSYSVYKGMFRTHCNVHLILQGDFKYLFMFRIFPLSYLLCTYIVTIIYYNAALLYFLLKVKTTIHLNRFNFLQHLKDSKLQNVKKQPHRNINQRKAKRKIITLESL